MRGSLGLRGNLSMMSRSGGLKPSAVAGSPSVTRFTHSSCTGMRASGKPRMAVRKMLWNKNPEMLNYMSSRAARGSVCVMQGESEQAPWVQVP